MDGHRIDGRPLDALASSVTMRPRFLIAVLCAALAGVCSQAAQAAAPVRHVFIIVLENKDYDDSFGPASKAPYLAKELVGRGQLLTQYYGIGHLSLGNYVAMVSGQSLNPLTQADCQIFQDVFPGTIGADGQVSGLGCVYPASALTVADQLAAKGLTWKGYMEDMGNSTTEARECRHPDLNSRDGTLSARVDDQYAARHNPFVYFHSIIDSPGCAANDVPLDRLPGDLSSEATTANYSFITPNLCHDGHDTPCVDDQPGGLVSANQFLETWVPQILASPAYQRDGMLIVTFDEADNGAESCCVDDAPNTLNAGGLPGYEGGAFGSGGGRIGAVILSPFVAPGTRNDKPYNHYSMLRTVEDLFALAPLGYAARSTAFGDDVFNGPRCFDRPLPAANAHGIVPRGSLIASADIMRVKGRLHLTLSLTHTARLAIRARVGKRLREKAVGPRRGKSCRNYVVTLPRGTRQVTVKASVTGARESRAIKAPRGRARAVRDV
jgi:hypothetical protein